MGEKKSGIRLLAMEECIPKIRGVPSNARCAVLMFFIRQRYRLRKIKKGLGNSDLFLHFNPCLILLGKSDLQNAIFITGFDIIEVDGLRSGKCPDE